MVHRSRWNDYHNDDTYFARPPIFFYRLNAFLKLKNIILRRGVPRYKPCSMNPAPACTLASSFLPLVSLFLSVLPLRFLVGIALPRRRFLPLFLPLSLSLFPSSSSSIPRSSCSLLRERKRRRLESREIHVRNESSRKGIFKGREMLTARQYCRRATPTRPNQSASFLLATYAEIRAEANGFVRSWIGAGTQRAESKRKQLYEWM